MLGFPFVTLPANTYEAKAKNGWVPFQIKMHFNTPASFRLPLNICSHLRPTWRMCNVRVCNVQCATSNLCSTEIIFHLHSANKGRVGGGKGLEQVLPKARLSLTSNSQSANTSHYLLRLSATYLSSLFGSAIEVFSVKAFIHYPRSVGPLSDLCKSHPCTSAQDWQLGEGEGGLQEEGPPTAPEVAPHRAVYLLNAIAFLRSPPTLSYQNTWHCFIDTKSPYYIYCYYYCWRWLLVVDVRDTRVGRTV